MSKIALTTDGNLYARFFIETGIPPDPFQPVLCSADFNAFENEDFYQYYRAYIWSNNGDANYTGILELEFYDTIGGSNIATGGTASASSEFNSTRAASKAFDGSLVTGDGWIPQSPPVYPEWLQYDFGAGNEKKVVAYKMGSYSTINITEARSVRTWFFQGSNDGTNWTTLHIAGYETNWTFGEMREFPTTQSFTGSHGGDTFECYDEEEDFTELSLAGTGFDGEWQIATTSSIGNPIGDDFESYTEGNVVFSTLNNGEGYDGPWLLGDEAANEIEIFSSYWSGYAFSTTQSVFIPEKITTNTNDLLVLALMRRVEVIDGLDGWTQIANQRVTESFTQFQDHRLSIHTRPYDITGSLMMEYSASNENAASLFVLITDTPKTIEIESSASRNDHSGSTVGSQHPITSLPVSEGDGRLGMVASTCVFAFTSPDVTHYTMSAVWDQHTPTSVNRNRFCVGTMPLSASQHITSSVNHVSHGTFNNHVGAEISIIFKPV